jgi:hypothetical protein
MDDYVPYAQRDREAKQANADAARRREHEIATEKATITALLLRLQEGPVRKPDLWVEVFDDLATNFLRATPLSTEGKTVIHVPRNLGHYPSDTDLVLNEVVPAYLIPNGFALDYPESQPGHRFEDAALAIDGRYWNISRPFTEQPQGSPPNIRMVARYWQRNVMDDTEGRLGIMTYALQRIIEGC